MERTAGLDHPAILIQKASVGQTALGIFLSGPGIGEIDKQPIDLLTGKDVLYTGYIHIDKKHVGEVEAFRFFHSHHHGFPATLHSNEQDIRICLGSFGSEFSLATAHLHPKGGATRHQCAPGAFFLRRRGDPVSGTFFHPRL